MTQTETPQVVLHRHVDGSEQVLPRHDGWQSALTGIGTYSHDKRLSARYQAKCVDYQELLQLYRTSDMAAKAVNSPPYEALRQGYEMVIADEGSVPGLKELVENAIHDLGVDSYVERLLCMNRAFGGGALLLGANDGQSLDKPLDLDRVTSLDWLSTIEPIELWPNTYYQNPNDPKYGEVETYRITPLIAGSLLNTEGRLPPPNFTSIHETRMIVMHGVQVSRYQTQVSELHQVWGDSILVRIYDVLRDFDVAFQAAGILVTDFGQSIFHMENLAQLVARQPAAIAARMAAIELGRSTARAVLVDTREKFERQSTPVGGLADLMDRLASRLAAAVDMPLTLLMGQSPKGLGNEGESDVRFYYDRMQSYQRRVVGPILRRIITIIIRAAKKKVPNKWGIKFAPLWQLTDQQQAEARLTQARADEINQKAGFVYPDEIRKSRFSGAYSFETQIDESKPAPGPMDRALPAGANPMPGSEEARAQGPNAAAPPPGSHVVGGYVRKNRPGKVATVNPAGVPVGKTTAPKAVQDAVARMRQDAATGDVGAMMRAMADVVAAAYMAPEQDAEYPAPTPRAFAGFQVLVENPVGSVRYWTDTDGTPGQTTMNYDYGYIANTIGCDADGVDVYLGPDPAAPDAYVINQMSVASNFMTFDEQKVMLGFRSLGEAVGAYMSQYDDPRFLGGVETISVEDLRKKLAMSEWAGRLSESAPDMADGTDSGAREAAE